MKIGDVLQHHFAEGRGFNFMYFSGNECNGDNGRVTEKIHGSKAMTDLIKQTKRMDERPYDDRKVYYGWILTWSDSFLRSYTKQKMNNICMHTITLPDPRRNATSPFHTYCIAIGQCKLDHNAVINWCAQETEELTKGRGYYCGVQRMFIFDKIGVVASLANCPEKAFILKTTLLGTYGKIASWAAEFKANVSADCPACFNKRVLGLTLERCSSFDQGTCWCCYQ